MSTVRHTLTSTQACMAQLCVLCFNILMFSPITNRILPGPCVQVYTYYGPDRDRGVGFLAQQDVVLTTYNVLSTEVEAKNGIMKVRFFSHPPLLRIAIGVISTVQDDASCAQSRVWEPFMLTARS